MSIEPSITSLLRLVEYLCIFPGSANRSQSQSRFWENALTLYHKPVIKISHQSTSPYSITSTGGVLDREPERKTSIDTSARRTQCDIDDNNQGSYSRQEFVLDF